MLSRIVPLIKTGQNVPTVVRITATHIAVVKSTDYREVKETLILATNENLSYRDAVKHTRAASSIAKPAAIEKQSVVETIEK